MELKNKREKTRGPLSLNLNFYPKCSHIGLILLGSGGDPYLGPLNSQTVHPWSDLSNVQECCLSREVYGDSFCIEMKSTFSYRYNPTLDSSLTNLVNSPLGFFSKHFSLVPHTCTQLFTTSLQAEHPSFTQKQSLACLPDLPCDLPASHCPRPEGEVLAVTFTWQPGEFTSAPPA